MAWPGFPHRPVERLRPVPPRTLRARLALALTRREAYLLAGGAGATVSSWVLAWAWC